VKEILRIVFTVVLTVYKMSAECPVSFWLMIICVCFTGLFLQYFIIDALTVFCKITVILIPPIILIPGTGGRRGCVGIQFHVKQ
jgi:TM2 domain-containing membrane protein YozV